MTIKRILLPVACTLLAVAAGAQTALPADSVLRRYAARMLMVGFKGDAVDAQSDAARYVRDLKVGAIVLFDVDLTGTARIGSRNVTSREQLQRLTSQLRAWADYPLLIALDQEGGRVARLKPQYGFSPTVSARYLGLTDSRDTTLVHATVMAREMSETGVNMNLAPVVDVHRAESPALGKIDRCYSDDAGVIMRHAGAFIDAHHRCGVACVLKHFPGHGSAVGDSHWGFVDVTSTWSPQELEPFALLIEQGGVDAVMTAHIINRNLDADYPATLSHKIIDGLLRRQLGFDGVVITDDLYMEAIIDHYSIERALVLAINAGADLLCVGNNISTGFEADRPFRLVDMIVAAVKRGDIPLDRIVEANRRVDALARRWNMR